MTTNTFGTNICEELSVIQFNPDKIARLISELRKAVQNLRRLRSNEKHSFLNDPDKIGSAKYHFIVAIESAIDICSHIVSRNRFRVPEDYADTFRVIHENGGFDAQLVLTLREMTKFRNRLVHLYWEVDDEQIYDILQTRLGDFDRFLERVSVFLGLGRMNDIVTDAIGEHPEMI